MDTLTHDLAASPPPANWRRWLRTAALVVSVSSMIALLMALMETGYESLPSELLISNLIGAWIWTLIETIQRVSRGRIGILTLMAISVLPGIFLGFKTAAVFGAPDIVGLWTADPRHEWKSMGVTLLFALSATAFVILFFRALEYRVELETERRRRAEIERTQAVAQLSLLQAQIEPHFLFNTLAHVQSAIDREPAVGKAMLEHLIRYLRGTLRRSRAASHTLAEELELADALLAIAAIRLGTRLRYRIVTDESLAGARLPPLLLQPLVENAIKHGIETAVDGGEVLVECERAGAALVLRVTDTGAGITAAAPEGLGLSNVRARVASLYGGQGRLTLHRLEPRGTVAELTVPL